MGDVIHRGGKKRNSFFLLPFLTPLLLFLAMPGHVGWWAFLFVALVPLLWSVAGTRPSKAFLTGLGVGFVYHTSMLYWIVIVLGRHGGLPLWLSIPAMLLLSLYMAVYPALFCWLASYCVTGHGHGWRIPGSFLFMLPALWVGLDWLRSILFTGFPWMDLGYGPALQPLLIQVADLGGHHLVTFLIVMVNVLVIHFLRQERGQPRLISSGDRLMVAIAVFFLVLCGGYSFLRYQHVARLAQELPSLPVGVVQGNVSQLEKWRPNQKQVTMEKYLALSENVVFDQETPLVVWPETALPFFPGNDPLFRNVQRWVDEKDTWLLTGAPHFELNYGATQPSWNAIHYFNSAHLVDPSGVVTGRYAKEHLVPFGEYVPLRKFLPFLEPLVESVGDFAVGRSGSPLPLQQLKLGILICYESIFPELARQRVQAGADILVNITNDAWYGRSSAPYQSFSMAILRAVETRRSMIRAANTGISGFIDPSGSVVVQSPIFETLSLSTRVPLIQEKTIFSRFGYLFGPACLAFALLNVIRQKRKNRGLS